MKKSIILMLVCLLSFSSHHSLLIVGVKCESMMRPEMYFSSPEQQFKKKHYEINDDEKLSRQLDHFYKERPPSQNISSSSLSMAVRRDGEGKIHDVNFTIADSTGTSEHQSTQTSNALAIQLESDGPLTGQPMANLKPGAAAKHSPSVKSNITVPKKRYSVWRKDSLIEMDTPVFTEFDRRTRKSVPSSTQTVLAMAGLFVCGLILLLSGIIVFYTQREPIISYAGLGLFLLGLIFLVVCAVLQRKNIVKWKNEMTRDLFALKEANGEHN